MGDTSIEWTDKSWNPVRGCSVVSEGCRNCYAMQVAARFSGEGLAYEGLAYRNESGAHWTGKVKLIEEHLEDPLHWRKPCRVFVNSMSDLFHESLSEIAIGQIFSVMAQCPQHVFQILTKRPKVMLETILRAQECFDYDEPLPNVWLGVSVEDQKTADERIPLLLQTPAAVRWISAEPLLGPIDLSVGHVLSKSVECSLCENDTLRAADLDWVVVGGESGPKARPMNPEWARSLRDQCVAAGVPFFFKQWGAWVGGDGDGQSPAIWQDGNKGVHPLAEHESCQYFKFGPIGEPGSFALKIGKKAAGRLLDRCEWNQFPQ